LPTRASRYCEALTTASGFGWYLFPPCDLAFRWDGTDVTWRLDGEEMGKLTNAQYPGLVQSFNAVAPESMKDFVPPFLSAFQEPGILQIWCGDLVRTAPDWSLLVRPPANFPRPTGYELYEGVIETDQWFGPLFTNIRLSKTDLWIDIPADRPFVQLEPIPRAAYGPHESTYVRQLSEWSPRDWERYYDTVVRPNVKPDRNRGEYAVRTRQRKNR
jgi:hypothetical protein